MSKDSAFHREPIYQKPSYDWEVWESDFSELVSEHYGIPYRLQQLEMLANDSSMDLEATDGEWEYGEEQLEKWEQAWEDAGRPPVEQPAFSEDRDMWSTHLDFIRSEGCDPEVLMWDLCRNGKLPRGKYLMRVWW